MEDKITINNLTYVRLGSLNQSGDGRSTIRAGSKSATDEVARLKIENAKLRESNKFLKKQDRKLLSVERCCESLIALEENKTFTRTAKKFGITSHRLSDLLSQWIMSARHDESLEASVNVFHKLPLRVRNGLASRGIVTAGDILRYVLRGGDFSEINNVGQKGVGSIMEILHINGLATTDHLMYKELAAWLEGDANGK